MSMTSVPEDTNLPRPESNVITDANNGQHQRHFDDEHDSSSSSQTALHPYRPDQDESRTLDDDDAEYHGEEQALFTGRNSSESTIAPASTMNSGSRPRTLDASNTSMDNASLVFRDRPQATPPAVISSRRRRAKQRSQLRMVWQIAKEALPTLILSLLSLMFAGELLVHLARWPVFIKVDKLFILLPILLNLKGNLEMNLSLRMSTSANIGELDIKRTRKTLIVGNMTLLQVQALIVSAGAGILAFFLGMAAQSDQPPLPKSVAANNSTITSPSPVIDQRSKRSTTSTFSWLQPRRIIHQHPKPPSDPALRLRNGYFEFVLVLATGMLSASISSAILGNFMCALVVVARQVGANPDNIASPLAASLGDLLTLIIVGLLASFLINFEGTGLATVIFILLLVACAACFVFTLRNTYVRELLSSGWVPLILAMFISSGAGLVLDTFVQRYQGFALLSPVVTGLPGACGAIFVSRITTTLHSGKGEMALGDSPLTAPTTAMLPRSPGPLSCLSTALRPLMSILNSGPPSEGWVVPLTLLCIGFFIESLFLSFVWASGQMTFGWQFVLSFCCLGLLGVAFALWLAHTLTLWLWARDYDPDIYCLPFVSSIVDVVGQAFLVAAFSLALFLGDEITASVGVGEGHGGV